LKKHCQKKISPADKALTQRRTLVALIIFAAASVGLIYWFFPQTVAGLKTYGWKKAKGTLFQAAVHKSYGRQAGKEIISKNLWLNYRFKAETPAGDKFVSGWRYDSASPLKNKAHTQASFNFAGIIGSLSYKPHGLSVFYNPADPQTER